MFLPIFCGISSEPRTITRPPNVPEPPKSVICPRCNTINSTVYKLDKRRCDICFCCCIPCGNSSPYVACSRCGHNLGGGTFSNCRKCDVGTVCKTAYCPNCGEKKN